MDVTIEKLNVILTRLQTVRNTTHAQLKPVEIDFKTMLDEIILFEKKKGAPDNFLFSYEIDNECVIVSDRALLKVALENLIDNSVKFRNESKRIEPFVKVKITNENDFVRIIVEDNGIGINSDGIDNIFKMFVRASEKSEIGGVGLYLVKAAADQIGASIGLVQSDTNGTIFQVLLPLDFDEVIRMRIKSGKAG